MRFNRVSFYASASWLIILVMGSAVIARYGSDPLAVDLSSRLLPPGSAHVLGTDELGRTMLSRLSHAALRTITITVLATIISIVVGGVLGLTAGWFGRWLDAVINGLINLFWSIPFAIFALLLLAITGPQIWSIVLVIAAVNWVSSARVFRAETARLRNEQFVRSARSRGFSASRILIFEVVPNLYTTAIVLLGLGGAETLSLESGLAYLGMSLPPPSPSWGGIMSEGLSYLSSGWWITALPALAIVATLASWRTLTSMISSIAKI